MPFDLHARVNAAVASAKAAALPFVPSYAQTAEAMAPVVQDILALPFTEWEGIFRGKVRLGSWDLYVLAEVRAAAEAFGHLK